MTTQLPSRERPDLEPAWGSSQARADEMILAPEVLFEEARRRRRRRWKTGGALFAAAVIVGALIFGAGGGGAGESGASAHGHARNPGSSAGAGHLTAGRLFPGMPATQSFYTGPGASCERAHRSHYLPAWSGCVSATVADVLGNGRPDLVLTYSLLSHVALTPRGGGAERYEAKQSMLRVVTRNGRTITAPIEYRVGPFGKTPAQLEKAQSAALISVAHVSDQPDGKIFLQTEHISSGSTGIVYTLDHSRLVSAGVLLGLGGDSVTQAGFQCLPGSPPRLLQHHFELSNPGIKMVRGEIYGRWTEATVTYTWHGPKLVAIAHNTVKRLMRPSDGVGTGCTKGIG
jgi:hypothetical protein